MYTASVDYTDNSASVSFGKKDENKVSNVALAILAAGAILAIFALIVHPVLIVPSAILVIAGMGVYASGHRGTRAFVSSVPNYVSNWTTAAPARSGYYTNGSSYSYATPSYAGRPAQSTTYFSNGGHGGGVVINSRR